MAKRFYQIAFELGLRPRAFIRALSELGLSVGNQMVVVPESLEERIRQLHERMVAPPAPAVSEPSEPMDTAVVETEAPYEPEAPTQDEREPEQPDQPEAPETDEGEGEEGDDESRARVVDDVRSPRRGELMPTLDPRAGRLVKDAPAGGVPLDRARPRPGAPSRGGPGAGGPQLPGYQRAPGARRESGRRQVDEPLRGKRGKETFDFGRRRSKRSRIAAPKVRPTSIAVELPVSVKAFGEASGYKAAEIIKVLFRNHGMMLTPNSMLDQDTCELLALELEIEIQFKERRTAETDLLQRIADTEQAQAEEHLEARPPVVTILGHVDHGKTTLLDYIRKSDTAAREAGGITQHIGASQVTLPDGRRVTFIDTPGHEAFTEMRARGAQVTDVVVLVVAADDGVMPQTVEAINHAKAASVTIVVAATKIDRQGANIERVKQQLTEHGIYVEGYGGDVAIFGVSGITGQGVPELLEHLALLADVDVEKFRANPDRSAVGTVIEAQNNPQRGILATVLVQTGTLHKGDSVVVGDAWGTVRALYDDKGRQVKSAGPGDPVEITGLDKAPEAGKRLYATDDAAQAKEIAQNRRTRERAAEMARRAKPATLEGLFGAIEKERAEAVNLVVKADVMGSLAPLKTILERLGNDEVRVNIVHSAVGAVNDSDVVLAHASGATVIAFHVNVDAKARQRAKRDHVEIRQYKVIYDIEKDVRDMLEGLLAPEMEEVVLGHAEILAIFTFSRIGNIAGCRVRDGIIKRDASVRVFRGEELLHEGQLSTLRREKEDVREVKEGFECGMTVRDFDGFEVGDTIEAYTIEAKKRTLAAS